MIDQRAGASGAAPLIPRPPRRAGRRARGAARHRAVDEAPIRLRNASRPKPAAWSRSTCGSKLPSTDSNRARASARCSSSCCAKNSPGASGHHRVERAARAEGDHRAAGGHRLERDDAEILLAGEQQRRGSWRRATADPRRRSTSGTRSWGRPSRAAAPPPGRSRRPRGGGRAWCRRAHGEVRPLVGHELADAEDRSRARAGRPARRRRGRPAGKITGCRAGRDLAMRRAIKEEFATNWSTRAADATSHTRSAGMASDMQRRVSRRRCRGRTRYWSHR